MIISCVKEQASSIPETQLRFNSSCQIHDGIQLWPLLGEVGDPPTLLLNLAQVHICQKGLLSLLGLHHHPSKGIHQH